MPEEESADVPMDVEQIKLPPIFEKFLSDLSGDRRRLLRDKNFENPVQLRAYIGQFLFARFEEMFRLLAGVSLEGYGLAASNTNEMRRLHFFTVEELNRLGADLDEEDAQLPGVSPETLNDFQQAFYALGTRLQEAYPDDTETETAYNRVAAMVSVMVGELMSGYDEEDSAEEDSDEDDNRDQSEKAEPDSSEDSLPPDVTDELLDDAASDAEEGSDG